MICSIATYRQKTNDMTHYDGDVEDALMSAQAVVERRTGRFFELAERTQTLKMYKSGLVYPWATPVTEVSVPLDAKTDGRAVFGATPGTMTTEDLGWLMRYPSKFSSGTLTYTGGYTPEEMPEEIVQAVAEIAFSTFSSDTTLVNIPDGATSVSVGDVTVAGKNLGGSSVSGKLPDHIYRLLIEWQRRDL